jgi:hypothetical protein
MIFTRPIRSMVASAFPARLPPLGHFDQTQLPDTDGFVQQVLYLPVNRPCPLFVNTPSFRRTSIPTPRGSSQDVAFQEDWKRKQVEPKNLSIGQVPPISTAWIRIGRLPRSALRLNNTS